MGEKMKCPFCGKGKKKSFVLLPTPNIIDKEATIPTSNL
jgi:hypothetical protein